MATFVISAIGTIVVLLLLASTGPFDQENAPSVLWSIVLWGMVGIGTFVVLLRLAMLAVVGIAGLFMRRAPGAAAEEAAQRSAGDGSGSGSPA